MLEYGKIDMPKRSDFSKTDGFRGYIICHYWRFLEINFGFCI